MAAAHLVDRLLGIAARLVEAVAQRAQLLLELEDPLHTREVQTVGGQLRDAPQPLDVAVAVAAVAADGARGVEQALPLVDAERLRMNTRELGCHRDHVDTSCSRFSSHHISRWARGDSSLAFANSSIALRSLALNRAGTATSNVTSRSPVDLPFDTPLPFTRRGFESGTEGLIFSLTGAPSSVGTSICEPSAASG